MKPSCCSSISRRLRTFLSSSSMVFGRASGAPSSSMGGARPAGGSLRVGLSPAASSRTAPWRAGGSARRSRCPEKQSGRWRRAGRRPGGGGEAALSGAGLSPAARTHHGRRRRKRHGERPAARRESAPSNGGSTHARPAKFKAESFPPSVSPSFQPSAPRGLSNRRRGTSRPKGSRWGAERTLNRSTLPLPRAPVPARPSATTF